jgi:hypothetical protein
MRVRSWLDGVWFLQKKSYHKKQHASSRRQPHSQREAMFFCQRARQNCRGGSAHDFTDQACKADGCGSELRRNAPSRHQHKNETSYALARIGYKNDGSQQEGVNGDRSVCQSAELSVNTQSWSVLQTQSLLLSSRPFARQ